MQMVREQIGAKSIACVIGGSMGGMQALEWTLLGGDYVRAAIVIACGAKHTAWQIGIGETQRQAIYADPKWNDGDVDMNNPPLQGLAIARQIAMISYRTASAYHTKFGRETNVQGNFQVKSYLEYQGKKFIERFNVISYIKITEQLDSHDIGAYGRNGIENALKLINSRLLVLGIDSDVLYPIHEQEEIVSHVKHAIFRIINSSEGHDGFLLEQDQVNKYITEFLQ